MTHVLDFFRPGLKDNNGGVDGRAISFDEVVRSYADYEGRRDADIAMPAFGYDEDREAYQERQQRTRDAAKEAFDSRWARFASREGDVLAHYFASHGHVGAALTASPDRTFLGLVRRAARPRLHVMLDLATAGQAADLVSRYERVRVKADQLLSGAERQHVMRVIYDRVCAVMRIVDYSLGAHPAPPPVAERDIGASAATESESERRRRRALEAREREEAKKRDKEFEESIRQQVAQALTAAEAEVVQTEELCDRAVRRVALMSYFVGMLIGIAVFTGLGIGVGWLLNKVDILGFTLTDFLTTFVAGAVGAIVSVMSRMSGGQVTLDYETGRGYLRVLGAFRPLIGAIFGVALYFALASDLLPAELPTADSGRLFFFFAFVAFLAGFSERWAQDMLVVGRRGIGTPDQGAATQEAAAPAAPSR